MRRLFPVPTGDEAATITAAEAAATNDRQAPAGRPWLELCMVTSVDGSTSLGQLSGGLSSPADVAMLSALRAAADMIVVGAGTVRAEGYGPPRRAGQRIAVISNTAEIDTSSALFRSGAGLLILPEAAPAVDVESIRCGERRVDVGGAVAQLAELYGTETVHAEGGPTLNAALLEADLVDELNLTISPRLVGGHGKRLVDGAGEFNRDLRLVRLLADGDFLFSRWLRADGAWSAG